MDTYQTERRQEHGHTWSVEWVYDTDAEAPWDRCDGHGPVSEWTARDKRPGEWVLVSDRCMKRYYNAQEAMQIARREGWGCVNPATGAYKRPSKGERLAAAVRADFEYLRGWCEDYWHYCGVVVKMDGHNIAASQWGIESNSGNYFEEVIKELMAECLDKVSRQTYPVTEMGL